MSVLWTEKRMNSLSDYQEMNKHDTIYEKSHRSVLVQNK